MLYVIVDWRPYDLPTVIGPFASEEEAKREMVTFFELDADEEVDGIDIRPLEKL